jgi:hypothetical protein
MKQGSLYLALCSVCIASGPSVIAQVLSRMLSALGWLSQVYLSPIPHTPELGVQACQVLA